MGGVSAIKEIDFTVTINNDINSYPPSARIKLSCWKDATVLSKIFNGGVFTPPLDQKAPSTEDEGRV